MAKLQFKFDSNQEHQNMAIQSTVDVFTGLERVDTTYQLESDTVPNIPEEDQFLNKYALLNNMQEVQRVNNLRINTDLITDEGLVLEGAGYESWSYPPFTIEMETGTGKTYVYLKTIYELKKQYGFRKFIIVVPSIAIYEGVIKNLSITQSHFKALYGNENIEFIKYDGGNISKLKSCATSQFVTILLMTIDSFNKSSNVIYKSTEKLPGEKLPYQYIQEARPILILDECQNYTSEKSKQALRTLHPLFSLNYSATPPQESRNLIYKLGPVEAFKMNLVKKIEVCGVTEHNNSVDKKNSLDLLRIERDDNNRLFAVLKGLVDEDGDLIDKEDIRIRHGEDLHKRTNNSAYEGYIVQEINKATGIVYFENGVVLSANTGTVDDEVKKEIFRLQIEEAIKSHLQKQSELIKINVKVLTLFFIDKVANYTDDKGIIKILFDQAFEKLKSNYPEFEKRSAEEVRSAYFAKKKPKKNEVVSNESDLFVNTNSTNQAERKLEKEAFKLIMRDKEKLLSFDEKTCFIFAHSALKEGWDNPNVFQICTLNNTVSESKKRQEIGRGMRLCVDQEGNRIYDDQVNILTVVANEAYEKYSASLQKEYTEAGEVADQIGKPTNARMQPAKRRDEIVKLAEFKKFWAEVTKPTNYKIQIDVESLKKEAIEKLNTIEFPKAEIVLTKARYSIRQYKITPIEYITHPHSMRIKIEIDDTDNPLKSGIYNNVYGENDDLSKHTKDRYLKPYKIMKIMADQGMIPSIQFANLNEDLVLNQTSESSTSNAVAESTLVKENEDKTYPVFNFINRAAQELKLTRKTLFEIYRELTDEQKQFVFKNPESFCSTFIKTIREVLADHIASRIEYSLEQNLQVLELDSFFPEVQRYPQKEIIEVSERSLYDKMQYDSDFEKNFIQNLLEKDRKVLFYFKFPSKFKVKLPKLIGNYIPDWGVVRWDDDNKIKLELVRETKGILNEELIEHPNEKRKIACAREHFGILDIDYNVITMANQTAWWENKNLPPF